MIDKEAVSRHRHSKEPGRRPGEKCKTTSMTLQAAFLAALRKRCNDLGCSFGVYFQTLGLAYDPELKAEFTKSLRAMDASTDS